ncbi:MAG TPA: D-alanine--D-alanine ligase [Spirochaetia bacterium]|nr:D-alanine--D-alanine ligase [Spirochaetia bacterium]
MKPGGGSRPVVIVHGRVEDCASPDEKDVLVEVEVVRGALEALGYATMVLPIGLNLQEAAAALTAASPALAFNLAESIDGRGSYIHLVPTLLDSMGIPYTGATCEAMLLTSHKLLGKRVLEAAGIPTPAWLPAAQAASAAPSFPPPWIVKSVWEHASVGLEDSSVVSTPGQLDQEIHRRAKRERVEHLFVEAFVDGREFNLALLGGARDGEPQNLPPAEIQFLGYPEGKPRMVGYRAKWAAGSYEYDHTPPSYEFADQDRALAETLVGISRACWKAFELRGYARVDFRVDAAGRPYVLEVNANPCLSPDAGFVAAAARAGLSVEDVIQRIVADAAIPGGRACR